jgi:transcriptional regulator with XRE-family HTH domain
MADMSPPYLGGEIRRLRLEAAYTLRGLAAGLEVSAAHMSDIEHNRRRPSEKLLHQIADKLRKSGSPGDPARHREARRAKAEEEGESRLRNRLDARPLPGRKEMDQ